MSLPSWVYDPVYAVLGEDRETGGDTTQGAPAKILPKCKEILSVPVYHEGDKLSKAHEQLLSNFEFPNSHTLPSNSALSQKMTENRLLKDANRNLERENKDAKQQIHGLQTKLLQMENRLSQEIDEHKKTQDENDKVNAELDEKNGELSTEKKEREEAWKIANVKLKELKEQRETREELQKEELNELRQTRKDLQKAHKLEIEAMDKAHQETTKAKDKEIGEVQSQLKKARDELQNMQRASIEATNESPAYNQSPSNSFSHQLQPNPFTPQLQTSNPCIPNDSFSSQLQPNNPFSTQQLISFVANPLCEPAFFPMPGFSPVICNLSDVSYHPYTPYPSTNAHIISPQTTQHPIQLPCS